MAKKKKKVKYYIVSGVGGPGFKMSYLVKAKDKPTSINIIRQFYPGFIVQSCIKARAITKVHPPIMDQVPPEQSPTSQSDIIQA